MPVKLIILPHAGGASHGYKVLADAFPTGTDIYCHDFPGHGRRSGEPLMDCMDGLVSDFFERADIFNTAPWAIFGHSMGALVGHAVIKERQRKGLSMPIAFFASGAILPSAIRDAPISNLPKDLFWLKIASYGGIPPELTDNPGIHDYFETMLRKDFLVVENYYPDNIPFEVPLYVLYSTADRNVAKSIKKWGYDTKSEVCFYSFSGGHFFLFNHISEISKIIANHCIGLQEKR